MPALSTLSGAFVLVTGGTGYVGASTIKDVLERGASVRAAVRTKEGGELLVKTFGAKVSYVVVPVIEAPGAYDEAVKDVDAILHVASPVGFFLGDPKEAIEPAVNGTVGILKSAHQFGTKVQRIVVTSSAGALESAGLVDETTYNHDAVKRVEAGGAAADPIDKYFASKTLSDRAAQAFVAENKPMFDLTLVLPSLVLGPWETPTTNKSGLSPSVGFLIGALAQPGKPQAEAHAVTYSYVDVRDVAAVHVLSLITPQAGGQRIIVSGHPFAWQDIYDALNAAQPAFPSGLIPVGTPLPAESRPAAPVTYNASKLFSVFEGFKLRSLEEATVDTVKLLVQKGWLTPSSSA